jgi:hypothetical protein
MHVSQADSEQLNQIRGAVDQQASIDRLMELCHTISLQVEDKQFPLTYAGILLALNNRIADAIRLLRLCRDRVFDSVVADYLERAQSFQPASKAFEETTPYDIWTQTDLYKSQMAATLDAIIAFARRTPPPSTNTSPTIIDIGPGNGVLLVEIIKRLLDLYPLEELHLILVEQSPKMLAATQEYCRESLSIPIKFTAIPCQLQRITGEQLAKLEEQRPIWFINASLSLHHMPGELKLPTMRMLASLSAPCLISEANANHDLPEQGSPELVYSVIESYGGVIQDLLKSTISQMEKQICIDNFLLTEATNILKNDRQHRVDYHALIPEWQQIAEQAGWKATKTTPTMSLLEHVFTFTMELQPIELCFDGELI